MLRSDPAGFGVFSLVWMAVPFGSVSLLRSGVAGPVASVEPSANVPPGVSELPPLSPGSYPPRNRLGDTLENGATMRVMTNNADIRMRLPAELKARATAAAEADHRTLANVVRIFLADYVTRADAARAETPKAA